MDPRERLIVALDVSTAAEAQKIVSAVADSALIYKVGLQLYTAQGPQIVRDLISSGRRVFLDLKYHDIPNTVGGAVREAAGLGAHMLTVHAGGGAKMLAAAVEAAKTSRHLKILAVTVLTSMNDADLSEVGVAKTLVHHVEHLAALAAGSGCHGVVSSAREATALRSKLGQEFMIVAPGVRPSGASHGDQARVVTPAEALAAGASHIVVGRPIIDAPNPALAAREILEEMGEYVPLA
jgi:orotidine-5'-phosphate decarboxylase